MRSQRLDVPALVSAIKECLPEGPDRFGLHEPVFAGNEWQYVKDCIDSGWVSSVGKYVDRFEAMLADFTGTKRAVAVVNGTAALHIGLQLAGVARDDEVLVPALTFVATANPVVYCGAVPHFIDSEERTLGVDPARLSDYLQREAEMRTGGCYNKRTGRRISAVVPMHVFGHPVDLDPLAEVCEHFQLALVEDAAESLGSLYKGRHTGNWGKVAVLSFNGNKTVTTGGGGAIITNDEEVGRLAKHLTTTAKVPHQWSFYHDQTGYNYRMPNINAALGCAQLEQLPGFIGSKRALARRYADRFAGVAGGRIFTEPDFACSNYWLNAFVLDKGNENYRDELLTATHAAGIITRPVWTPMHRLPMFTDCPRMDLRVAEELESRIVNLPSSAFL